MTKTPLFLAMLMALALILPYNVLAAYDCSDADNCTVTCDNDGDSSDIQGAVDDSNIGGTITFSANTCDCDAEILIEKTLTLVGAGIDSSYINMAFVGGYSPTDQLLDVDMGDGEVFTMSGFTITNSVDNGSKPIITFRGTQQDNIAKFIVHDIKLSAITGRGIWIDTIYGVIYDCQFLNTTSHPIYVEGDGDAAWTRDVGFGTINAAYIEDNTISYQNGAADSFGAWDMDDGARLVFRYNDITNHYGVTHGYQDRAPTTRGALLQEIYENTWVADGDQRLTDAIFGMISIRSGTGVIFNNLLTEQNGGTFTYGITFAPYNACPTLADCGTESGHCAGNGSCDAIDTSYPLVDQPGRGKDQALDPVYIWNNFTSGDTPTTVIFKTNVWDCDDASGSGASRSRSGNCDDGSDAVEIFVEEDYDYYYSTDTTDEKPDYTPYGTFVNDRYYYPLRDDIPTGASQLGITDSGISHGNGG